MAAAAVVAAVVVGPGCGRRSPESRAAERAQDACIGALAPVADDRVPSAGTLDRARADAEAAAGVDDRWGPLLADLEAALAASGTPDLGPAVESLVAECDRVNDIVRRGGREPTAA